MTYINAIEAAIKAKAPIVAIPIEGHAPICLNRLRLTRWAKGVKITHTEVEERRLLVKGSAGRVRCNAAFVSMDRRMAVKELAKWSDRERKKRQKKLALGALSPEMRRVAKLEKAGIVETMDEQDS